MKINFSKILIGVFIFFGVLGLLQILKDSTKTKTNYLSENIEVMPASPPWPNSWVEWTEIFEGEVVKKYAPKFSKTDFIISLPTRIIKLLPNGSSCVGDSEVSNCFVGKDEGIKKVFENWSNLY